MPQRRQTAIILFLLTLTGCAGVTGPLRQFEHGAGWARSAAFSRDGTLLAATCADGTIRVWEVRTGRELARAAIPLPLPDRDYTLDGAAFAPDGGAVAFAAAGGRALVWRWRDGASAPPRQAVAIDVPVKHVAFTDDGRALTAAGGGLHYRSTTRPTTFPALFTLHVRRVELSTNQVVYDLRDERCGALSVALAAGGERLAVTCMTTPDGQPVRQVSPDATRDARSHLRILDLTSGRQLTSIPDAGNALLTMSDDASLVAAGREVWDARTGRMIRQVEDAVSTFSADGRAVILMRHFHGSTGLWPVANELWVRPVRIELKSGQRAVGKRLLFRDRVRHIEPPVRAAFSPDGRYFVDYDLNLWHVAF